MSELRNEAPVPTLQELAAEVPHLRERIEDLEDARELDASIQRNGGKPLISWNEAKKELGLDF
jgi:hypothetical protein